MFFKVAETKNFSKSILYFIVFNVDTLLASYIISRIG